MKVPYLARRELQNTIKVECNDQVYSDVASRHGISPKQVEELLQVTSRFIKEKMEHGAFETVMLPGFGKFTPHQRRVQRLASLQNRRINEAISNRSGRRSGDEHPMDKDDTGV